MNLKLMLSSLVALCIVLPLAADDAPPGSERSAEKPVFRQITAEEAAKLPQDGAVTMGDYRLEAAAVRALQKADTFKAALDKIAKTDWTLAPWNKENADLTIRQRMDDYLDTALAFYEGRGKRKGGVIGKREEKVSDTELGDRQLSSALVSVQMAAAWNVPLQRRQAERLNAVIQKRLRLAEPKEKP